MHYRAARVNKECIEATNAVFTGKPQPVIRRETLEAIDALAQMRRRQSEAGFSLFKRSLVQLYRGVL